MTWDHDRSFPGGDEFHDATEEELAAAAASARPISRKPNGHDTSDEADESPLSTINWPAMEGRTPPEREFVVEG